MSHKIFKEESTMLTKKKLASLAMAGVMTMSLAAPAFAATTKENTTNRSLKVTAAYQAVTINVVVPTTGTVVINPYSLPVQIGTDSEGQPIKVQKQIVTKPLAIKNQCTDVALDMNISATTSLTGSMSLATGDIENVATDQKTEAYIYMEVAPTTITGAKDSDALSDAGIADAYSKFEWPEFKAWTTTDTDGNGLVLKAGTTAQTANAIVTLAKATADDSGAFSEYANGGVAFIGFLGSCAQNPKTAWTAKDGLTCTVAFTFTPHVEASADENT
jgi:hypothetical protein